MQRRTLLKVGLGSLLTSPFLLGCQQRTVVPTQQSTQLTKFGLQLSTVTPLMLADFEGTLEKVAQIGYQQVEFSAMGFLGRSAQQVQGLLAQNKLEAPVGRIAPVLPEGFFQLPRKQAMQIYRERGQPKYLLDNVKQSLEAAVALGQGYLVLPALMPDNFKTLKQVQSNIDLINQAAELCAKQGVVFGYHNHNWELVPIDGKVPYNLMLQQTDPDKVTFQMDAYWIVKGGGNLSEYLARYPGRFATCHLKDIDANGDFADVGDGLIDFPRFTKEAMQQGAKYFFVERDNPPKPAESIQRSYDYLKTLAI